MLKGIDNRLNAEVLGTLRAMGHGDVLIVCDTNFPADQVARATVTGRLLRMENLTAAQAVNAMLTVLPLIMQLNWVLRYIRERRLPLRYLPFAMVSLPVYSFALLSSLPKAYFNHFTGRRGWYKSVRHDDATLELPERHAEPARSNVTAPAASD